MGQRCVAGHGYRARKSDAMDLEGRASVAPSSWKELKCWTPLHTPVHEEFDVFLVGN